MLTAYERQRRLTRNFLEGARKKRLSYTPLGLYEAGKNLDAATKVHVATAIGLIVSVSLSIEYFILLHTNGNSLYLRSHYSLALVVFMGLMGSSARQLATTPVAGELNGTRLS